MKHIIRRCAAAVTFPAVLAFCEPQQMSPQQSTPEGLALLRKMQAALGGADKIAVTSPKPNVLRITHDNNANDFTLDPSGLPLKTNGVSLANPDGPVQSELRFETWTEVGGVKFPARRANYHNGLKLGEITESITEVNMGLKPETLAAQPANFFPEIARDK